jgi:hypothetical protein
MPLSTTILKMDAEIGNITKSIPKTEEELQSWNLADRWGNVAKIFFGGGIAPKWTPTGLASGKELWMSTVLSMASSPQDMNMEAMESAFMAFASLATIPGNVVPPFPVVQVPPVAPPNLKPLGALPPSSTTLPSTTVLHSILLVWASTGTQTIPLASPTPWS